MERQIISKRISEILGEITRLSGELRVLGATIQSAQSDDYTQLSVDAAIHAERITCRIRHLIYANAQTKKAVYLSAAADAHGIRIEQIGGVIKVTLPGLMPKRRRRMSNEFLLDPLYFALTEYAETHSVPRYRDCVVCFSHVYSRELPTRRIRDYDNLELKHILDVIAGFFLTDDTGLLCDVYNSTELGGEDCTKVSLMDKTRFRNWLYEREATL